MGKKVDIKELCRVAICPNCKKRIDDIAFSEHVMNINGVAHLAECVLHKECGGLLTITAINPHQPVIVPKRYKKDKVN